MIEITVQLPDESPRIVSFDENTVRIGRDPKSDLVLDSAGCSRHHAEIRFSDGHYRIVDLGSTNGVRFGTQKVPELLLFDGAAVSIGEWTLTFAIKGADLQKTMFLRVDDLPTTPPRQQQAPEPAPAAAAVKAPAQPAPKASPPSVGERSAAATPVSTLYLLVSRGKKVENFKIAAGVDYVIGRSPNADVVLDDRKSSLQHARISSREGRFYVCDLGSSNGTLLRGQPIEEAEIKDGDTFIVGDTPITLSAQRYDLSDEVVLMDQTLAGFRIPSKGRENAAPVAGGAKPSASSGFERLQGLSIGKTVAIVAAGLILVGGAAWFLLRPDREPSREPQTTETAEPVGLRVSVRRAERKSLAAVISGSGNIKPLQSATVGAEVSGRVLAINVSVGSAVTAGTVVARLNDTDIRLQIEEARSAISKEQVDTAREDYERKQRLFAEHVLTRSVLDLSKNNYLGLESAYKSSQARIRQLQEQLTKTSIRAPFGGVVVRTFANAGELIGPGSPVVGIENQTAILVELELSDRDLVRVSLGLPVRARVDAFPGRVFNGAVERVGTTANPTTKSFTVEARVENADGSLRSGMIAELDIVLAEREGLAAPAEALFEVRDNHATVFTVEDGLARRRTVTTGRHVDRDVEILDGLEEGAVLVVSGQERLNDGAVVTVFEGHD